jgi:hypothetical protein
MEQAKLLPHLKKYEFQKKLIKYSQVANYIFQVKFAIPSMGTEGFCSCSPDVETVTTSNLIQIRSARYVFHRNPRTIVAIYIT